MPCSADDWYPVNGGATIGAAGSEDGTVVLDEEHPAGTRITLEKQTAHRVPWAITCGVYGWMVHTRFFDDEASARTELTAMKRDLVKLATAHEPDCGRFVERYP